MGHFWKNIERTCTVVAAICALVTVYYTAGTYYGWNAPAGGSAQQTAKAGASAAMMPIWPIISLGTLAVILTATAWVMIILRTKSERREASQPSGLMTVQTHQPTVAEQQLETELRRFVLSRLEAVVSGFFGVFHEMRNRYEGLPPEKRSGQWPALAQSMSLAAELGIAEPFAELRNIVSRSQFHLNEVQIMTKQFLTQYYRTKQLVALLSQATGLAPNQGNLAHWHSTEASGAEARRDLSASRAAIYLHGYSDSSLSTKVP